MASESWPSTFGHNMPAVGFEALRCVVGEPAFNVAVDGNAVVVPEGDQLAEAQRAGQRAGFVRNAFHQATIAEEGVGVVIDDFVARLVELGSQHLFGQREADGVSDALAERAGRGFNARRVTKLGVTRCFGVQLAEIFQIIDRQIVASEVQQRINQHRAVAVRHHETVAVRPVRVGRVVAQMAAPQNLGDFRHAHRHARVAGVGLLHGIHGQGADGASQRRKLRSVADAHDRGIQPAEKVKLSGKCPLLGRAIWQNGRLAGLPLSLIEPSGRS
jgi:hypothetical protein